jgi:hypothetical protein
MFGTSGKARSITQISSGNDTQNLLKNVDLNSIHVLRFTHQLAPALWAQSIITTPQTPLLIAGENNNQRIAALGFDLHDSDLPLQSSFPILMYNLVNWFMPSPVPGDGQISPDTPVTVSTWPGADQVTITPPGQQPITVAPPFPVAPFARTNTTGIYTVMQRVHGLVREGAFTVNLFDPLQSRLAPAAQLPVAHSSDFNSTSSNVPRVLREIWPEIAALLLLILCLEWWLFGRSYGLQLRSTGKDQEASAGRDKSGPYGRGRIVGQRGSPFLSALPAPLRDQLEKQYRVTMRRFAKAIRRIRGKRVWQKSKGKIDAHL